MFKLIGVIVLAVAVFLGYKFTTLERFSGVAGQRSIFEFTVEDINSKALSLSEYKGKKAYLVVNVASQCGLTKQNYAELQEVYEKYQNQGLEILAFPCDNFLHQEPSCNADILSFAQKTKGATFPVLGKLECDNFDKTHPLYQYLKSSLDGGLLGQGLKWNFAKFLCDANGIPIKRYAPNVPPLAIEADIVSLLQ